MKDTLLTSLRHAFTALAGLGGFLLAHGAIETADAANVNAAGATLGEALAVIVAALVARLVVFISGKIVSGSASSIVVCLCLGTLAGAGLSACSDYPITGTLSYRDPNTGAKAGLSYSPATRIKGGITVPIYDAQTGELLGVTDVKIDPQSGK